ncbi:hypothetical protein PVL29_009588 [Vitis rotundifolia]|uniref:Uncharacterized protein n=1 Tax=Vitis rotundifolia TaxID=103349 RepID=A0AA38ZR79_VITRO|nr:hypothetical protein PVL29_009588 [Vitis rotundifolia]
MVGSGLQKSVEGNGEGKKADCNGGCVVGFQGLKEAQVFKGFSSKAAHLCGGPLEGSKVLNFNETHRLPVLCVAQGGGEGSANAHYSSDSKNSPLDELTLIGASFSSMGHDFQNPKLSHPVELHTRHGLFGRSAASSPSFCGTGLGSEGCEVVFAVDSLGEDSSPFRMVLVNDSLLEYEEAGVIPIEVTVGEKDKEEGSCLGLVSRAKVPMENWSSSNLAAFGTWLGMPTVGFEAEILALRKMKARKEITGREDGKRKKNSSSSKSEREIKKLACFVQGIRR